MLHIGISRDYFTARLLKSGPLDENPTNQITRKNKDISIKTTRQILSTYQEVERCWSVLASERTCCQVLYIQVKHGAHEGCL